MSNHMFDAIHEASKAKDATFIETVDGRVLTYGDMLDLSGRFASALALQGLEPGDRVAVQVEKSPEALMLYLGCLRAGLVYLPLNTTYTRAEIDYFISDAEPRLVVVGPAEATGLKDMVARHGGRIETMDAKGLGSFTDKALAASGPFIDVTRAADDLAAILYTSGTTGRSKGAMLTHENLRSNALTLKECWRFTPGDRLIHALPIFHTHGLFVATNVVLTSGASMFFLPKFDANQILSLMPRSTAMMGVPTFYVRLLQNPGLNRDIARGMRLFVAGSAPLLAETHHMFCERTGHAILERYGMTETNMTTSNPYDRERIAGTVGFPLPGVRLRIVDPQSGEELPRGQTGMIEVKGPNVFKGYWRMPEKTRTEFRPDGYFITGDLGVIDDRGYVSIVGRDKDLVISGGYNIYPKEIETEIDRLPGVIESAVIGVPHPDFGEGVTAVVVKRQDAEVDESRIIASLADRLARYKQPKSVIFVDELPRNAMGKVQKNLLREAYADLYERPSATG